MKTTTQLLLTFAVFVCSSLALQAADGFSFDEQSGRLDILYSGKPVARYMCAYDKSSSAKRTETYKPYLHIFDAEGVAPITKGPGGEFTHHRGIFIGWNKITFNGKNYDRWHMIGGEQVHQKYLAQKLGPDSATFTSLVHWNDEAGKEFIVEERTCTFRRGESPAYQVVDFASKLTAPRGDVKLNGDPEHAGIHFRPANEVDRKKTVYFFPKENPNAHKDIDYPWVAETITLGGKEYSIVEMSHPANPEKTRWSAYRDYGRFGAFPVTTIPEGKSASFQYRFVIASGPMLPVEAIQKIYNQYAATTAPVPKMTSVLSEQPKTAATSTAKPAKQ